MKLGHLSAKLIIGRQLGGSLQTKFAKIGKQLKTKYEKLMKIINNKPDAPMVSAASSTVIPNDCNSCFGNNFFLKI